MAVKGGGGEGVLLKWEWGAVEGTKFAVSTWLTTLRLRIPCLFLCLTTAVFPVRQEVSSVSCHCPLSCGHFLVFCQCHSVLLTQRTEVVLLVVGPGRIERSLFFYYLWLHELHRNSNVRLLPAVTPLVMIAFLCAKKGKGFHSL